MPVDVTQPFGAYRELVHPHIGREGFVRKAPWTACWDSKNPIVHKRITPCWECFQIVQMLLTVLRPGFKPEEPLMAVKAELCKAMHAIPSRLVAVVNMFPVVTRNRAIEDGLLESFTFTRAFLRFQSRPKIHFRTLAIKVKSYRSKHRRRCRFAFPPAEKG